MSAEATVAARPAASLWRELRYSAELARLLANVDCAERIVTRLERQVQRLAAQDGRSVVLIGQSRGGALARAPAVRNPAHGPGLAMLGAPVRDSLAGPRRDARRGERGRMEWMSAIDSSFLHVENDTTPMHIGGVSIFEGPPPPSPTKARAKTTR